MQTAAPAPATATPAAAPWSATLTWLDRDVLLIRDALPFAGDLVRAAAQVDGWHPCTVIGDGVSEYVDGVHRSSQRLTISSEEANRTGPLAAWCPIIGAVEGVLVAAYRQQNPHARVVSGTGWDLLRYGVGDRFGEHVDVVRGHPSLSQRLLSVVAFCNDDFEGGELRFPRQDITIRPETGAVVIFPAGFVHPHEALPVKSGMKYSLVTWFV